MVSTVHKPTTLARDDVLCVLYFPSLSLLPLSRLTRRDHRTCKIANFHLGNSTFNHENITFAMAGTPTWTADYRSAPPPPPPPAPTPLFVLVFSPTTENLEIFEIFPTRPIFFLSGLSSMLLGFTNVSWLHAHGESKRRPTFRFIFIARLTFLRMQRRFHVIFHRGQTVTPCRTRAIDFRGLSPLRQFPVFDQSCCSLRANPQRTKFLTGFRNCIYLRLNRNQGFS